MNFERADTTSQLVSFAKDYARSKAAILDQMPNHVVVSVSVWLNDMIVAAEAGDADRVNRICGRIGSRLKNEMSWQLTNARKDRDRRGTRSRR
jgi:hypothetical protein